MTRTDEELVARATAGDLDSFNQLVSRWERPIYALAYRTLGREEDARDVVQEAFLRAYRGLAGIQGRSQVLVVALPHHAESLPGLDSPGAPRADRAGARGRRPGGPGRRAGRRRPSRSRIWSARREMSRAVAKAMAELPEEQRTAIMLKEYHGLTFQEIADHARLSAEHGEDAAVSGTVGAASAARAAAGRRRRASGARRGKVRAERVR